MSEEKEEEHKVGLYYDHGGHIIQRIINLVAYDLREHGYSESAEKLLAETEAAKEWSETLRILAKYIV